MLHTLIIRLHNSVKEHFNSLENMTDTIISARERFDNHLRLGISHQYQTSNRNKLDLERRDVNYTSKNLHTFAQKYLTVYLKTFNSKIICIKFKFNLKKIIIRVTTWWRNHEKAVNIYIEGCFRLQNNLYCFTAHLWVLCCIALFFYCVSGYRFIFCF